MSAAAWALSVALLGAAPVKLGAPGLNGTGYSKEQLAAFGEHLAVQFKAIAIITQADVQALLGMERQKQLLGCADQSACMAELGAALGVDGLLLGDVTKLEGTTQLTLRVVSSVEGKRLALCSERITSDREVFEVLERCTRKLEADTLLALGRTPRAAGAAWPWVVGAVGLGLAGAGAGLAVSSASELAVLRAATRPVGDARTALQVKQDGELKQALAIVGFAAGGAALTAAILGLVFGGSGAQASAWLTSQSAGLSLAWEWP